MVDYRNDPEFKRWCARADNEMIPKLEASGMMSAVFTGKVDAKFAVEFGAAVLMNKPIIALVKSGVEVPEKMARVVDKFVEFDPDKMEETASRTYAAIEELRSEGLIT